MRNIAATLKPAIRKASAACMAALLAFGLSFAFTTPAHAGYTYTITLLSGAQGDLASQGVGIESGTAKTSYTADKIIISNLSLGDRVSFPMDIATTSEDSKYYVKGVRMGGRDNSDANNSAPSIEVTEDRDYVVAYGMKGELVDYTVQFLDTAGNHLIPNRTYYGNVGDMPVIAYVYIDGYVPQAYNITGTLTANPEENIFTFVYTRLAAQTVQQPPAAGEGGVTTIYEPGPVTTVTTPAPAAPGAVAPAPAATETLIAEDGTPLAAPEELINIDDNENPLAQPAKHPAFSENESGFVMWPTVLSAVILGAGVIIFLLWFFLLRKKWQREKEYGVDISDYPLN